MSSSQINPADDLEEVPPLGVRGRHPGLVDETDDMFGWPEAARAQTYAMKLSCECGGCAECVTKHKHKAKLKRNGLLPPPPWTPPEQPKKSRPFIRAEATNIRDEYAMGKTAERLATEYGVVKEKIIDVLRRRRWGDER